MTKKNRKGEFFKRKNQEAPSVVIEAGIEWYDFIIYSLCCSWSGLLMLIINKPVIGLVASVMALFLSGLAIRAWKNKEEI